MEVRSLLNLRINSSESYSGLSFRFENGFVRDSGNGLVFRGCSPTTGFVNEVANSVPVDQPKSEHDDIVATVRGYLTLKRLLQDVIEVEINDVNDSDYLKNSEFRVFYDEIVALCDVCSQSESQSQLDIELCNLWCSKFI